MPHKFRFLFFLSTLVFFTASFISADSSFDTAENKGLIRSIKNIFKHLHYHNLELNDALSNKIYLSYIENLDPSKQFLLQSDLDYLKTFKFLQDDALVRENFEFVKLTETILKQRIEHTQKLVRKMLQTPISFEQKLFLHLKPEHRSFSQSQDSQEKLWRYILSYAVIQEYILLYKKEFPKKELSATSKIISKIEKQARENTLNNYERTLKRMYERPSSFYLNTWINSFTGSLDPHSNYIPAQDKEDFDIRMTGQLEGIGAVLTEEKGEIKVLEIVPGGAAWKQKGLEAEDIILKVSDHKHKNISLKDMPVSEAVHYIRGKKNTIVILDVRKADGQIKTIPIKREVVTLEASYAKSFIIKTKDKKSPYAYVQLPSFYRDFSNKKARNASDDLQKILISLKKKAIQGLILDLRNNGGGSLKDAIEISGHFIEKGPIVQIQDRSNSVKVLRDEDESVLYSGPLIVLTNHGSASASEIVAGALQDYSRAFILGSDHSYGKGTVQNLVPLRNGFGLSLRNNRQHNKGSLKITTDKYYRIDGTTTQYKGVLPDIVAPDVYDYLDIGENTQNYALPFSIIESVNYQKWQSPTQRKRIIGKSKQRIAQSTAFQKVKQRNEYLKSQSLKPIQLSLKAIVSEMETTKSFNKSLDSIQHSNLIKKIQAQNAAAKIDKKYIQTLEKDILIQEAVNILNDVNTF